MDPNMDPFWEAEKLQNHLNSLGFWPFGLPQRCPFLVHFAPPPFQGLLNSQPGLKETKGNPLPQAPTGPRERK